MVYRLYLLTKEVVYLVFINNYRVHRSYLFKNYMVYRLYVLTKQDVYLLFINNYRLYAYSGQNHHEDSYNGQNHHEETKIKNFHILKSIRNV